MPMAVHFSPAQLANLGFTIESKPQPAGVSVLVVQSNGHKLTPAGVKGVLGAVNTYLAGLSAANLALVLGYGGVSVGGGVVQFPVLTADAATQAAALQTQLTAAGNAAAG